MKRRKAPKLTRSGNLRKSWGSKQVIKYNIATLNFENAGGEVTGTKKVHEKYADDWLSERIKLVGLQPTSKVIQHY